MNKFKSRKFWIAVGTVFSIALAEAFGVHLDPETIAGIVVVVSSYIFGQGLVDKSVITAQVGIAGDVGRVQIESYARNLEEQLKLVTASLETQEAVNAALVPPVAQLVPDSE